MGRHKTPVENNSANVELKDDGIKAHEIEAPYTTIYQRDLIEIRNILSDRLPIRYSDEVTPIIIFLDRLITKCDLPTNNK